ncbi:MAG: FMN-binding glutamate synthase family protein, partial [Deltaproteobacteria bacterium CG23_combo_of_CG06-09_8_20_14_all_51_20]
GIYSVSQKLQIGLQQLMAGARKWRVDLMTRKDLAALTEEAAKVTGIPYIMDTYKEEALKVIDA